jgi:hypothetical protein
MLVTPAFAAGADEQESTEAQKDCKEFHINIKKYLRL